MNTANKLTMLRILMVPAFVLFMYLNFENSRIVATVIFAIASFTDFLDGYIARKNNLVTNFGKFADPLADKILVAAALICLTELGDIPAWGVIIIIAREFAVTGFRIIAASENITIAASPLGKIKTVSQLVSLIILLTNITMIYKVGIIIFYVAIAFTIISGIDYFVKNKKVLDLENI
ncbi:CDP-diacylglycerol--glycerol-3-phosphate 3-phosphatidyltransferase [Peptoniphilus asaccharolyticus DSM 20463]|uniref:CDP-diacylglycerol--glycerol-3-phosphate 3-phosphatidyltransferase n=1 Tax=Peptoniphilus asaccharolyticus DSM 20463 TaxID=573058 RepID=A0A1W1UR91_PEPAS|nr:CDP-diacylglycerol--glycerol-3-phosphate 3-phosphatidyltransferase [Peptoniphilus asaccharolyticus]MBL7575095.1 CDP-diacylglycerol--glycerol-3-phosphate 3-phosphatidyltransferase [Peptoniphilus asaccharolyticus]SMB83658.1 CDP-diacylglycerol--glycerol-3-phosphate 3-phosphatidyltransferase [Peptoniphilus asaccharolyticus DSM 20463]